ncbi:class I SAM-dependent methyltransferase [Burkholderia alba]|uniref:class I SAM-dependent methyltransferase n=1 Tax=Burkholderia alba TaxID=2683677 RepID=UPI002B059AEF|nr:methyltransferase [Burkholderia alba]
MNRLAVACLATLLTVSAVAHAQTAPPDAAAPPAAAAFSASQWSEVLGGAWRPAANRARDVYRHPEATLTFFGFRPGETVIEIAPSPGWYSEILAPLLRDNGRYIAAQQLAAGGESTELARALAQKFAADPACYGAASIVSYDAKAPTFGPPGSADLVLTFRNVHNWTKAGTAEAMFKAFYAVLRPGGTLGVVDHRAAPGTSMDAANESGYLPVAYLTKLATDAGFVLAGSSEINANPKDVKHYPKGVWTLPPTLALGEQDRQKYLAIGESDRMTLRFVKPAAPAGQ